jgi:hypothetical protein
MPNVYWTDEARVTFDGLPDRAQREIQRRLAHLRRFPDTYPLVSDGRYRGFRHFTVLDRYQVYYRVAGVGQDCYIRTIRPARAQPE